MSTTREDLLPLIESHYRELVGTQRALKPTDRLTEDLNLDSLLGYELLAEIESKLGVKLIGDERLLEVGTVADLLAVLQAVIGESRDGGAALASRI